MQDFKHNLQVQNKIEMVDLRGQYQKIKSDIDTAIQKCLDETAFIKGKQVTEFQNNLEKYLNVNQVVACANGTDALQLAMMALDLKQGDEVIIPAFTYIATAEVLALLGLRPVLVDVDYDTFNISSSLIESAITSKTRLIVPVHLFGQCYDMENIINLASEKNIFVVEDTAQAIGAKYTFSNGITKSAGAIGQIGCTSFFPSKNLGCYGDGGAVYTNDPNLGKRLNMIANHGQQKKYTHELIGVNSRLDTIQAAILNEKLRYIDEYNLARLNAANVYDDELGQIKEIEIPYRNPNSTHVFHQYTIKVKSGKRDELKNFLAQKGIPSMIYYPFPLHKQPAYKEMVITVGDLSVSSKLCSEVLSLPMHTELNEEQLSFIIEAIKQFYK